MDLHASEWRLWSYLVTLDPFGNRYQDMPDLLTILEECQMSKATFYRALAKFEEHQLFDTQPLRVAFRNLRGQKNSLMDEKGVSPTRLPVSSMRNSVSPVRLSSEEKISNPLPNQGSSKSSDVPITDQICSETTEQTPTRHPVSKDINGEGIGTPPTNVQEAELERLSTLIQDSGIRLNKTIKTTIGALLYQQGAAAAAKTVENALSALQEQQRQGAVRNPGGFFNSALRRGFTANQAKKDARERRENRPEPPSLDQVSLSVDMALRQRDRTFALGKLQQLWSEGWHDQVRELLYLRKDWGFSLKQGEVRDGTCG